MEIFTNLISTILQIVIFTFIPFISYLFLQNKSGSFLRYIGLYRPSGKSVLYVVLAAFIMVATGVAMPFLYDTIRQIVISPNSVSGELRLMGLHAQTILILLITALFKTSLSEEILFRGFIAQQLFIHFGFKTGNFIQAAIFGLVHLVLFAILVKTTWIPLTGIFIFSGLSGWILGFIKEKYANGSIVPGWIAHAIGNTISYAVIAFIL